MGATIVNVEQGKLKGKTKIDFSGNIFYSFQGIPFAKPPLGDLRFKDPQSAEPWQGVKDATKEGTVCYQVNMLTGAVEGGEDCLFLNVYTPQINKQKDPTLKPVMFWVHGGGFVTGSGNTDIYGPEFLVANDVVLVTTNYRLGILGFLQLDDPALEVPGNAALKDLVLSLRWVQTNIKNFLGDPNNITIFGESAGALAVQYLVLSPLAKGLFHKAVLQSGSAFFHWNTIDRKNELYAEVLNLKSADERQILNSLLELSVEELFEFQQKLDSKVPVGKGRPYGVAIEKPSRYAFLAEQLKSIWQSGTYNKVPILIGYTDAEGILSAIYAARGGVEPIHKSFEGFVPSLFGLEKDSNISKQIADKIKKFYYGNKEPSMETLDSYIELESDAYFTHGIHKTVENAVKKSSQPVFLYRFALDQGVYLLPRIFNIPFKGAGHGDELIYLFKSQQSADVEPGSTMEITIKRITKLWTNFAKYGDPNAKSKDEILNVEWKPVTEDETNYLNIDEELTTGVNPEAERVAFWDELYKDFPDAKYW